MKPNINNVHFVWIGERLSLLEQLSIKSFQRHGFIANLWSYNLITNVPENTILRNAEEILSKDSLFSFQGTTNLSLTNNGIGSFSHWSDTFQLLLLKKYGEWYSQLDVSCLKRPEDSEYYFSPHPGSRKLMNTFIMKTPPDAPFIDDCLIDLRQKINTDTCTQIDWYDSMRIIRKHINKYEDLKKYYSSKTYECGSLTYMQKKSKPSQDIEFIHWCNSTVPKNTEDKYIISSNSFFL